MTEKRNRKEYMDKWLSIKEKDLEWVERRRQKQIEYYRSKRAKMSEEDTALSRLRDNDYARRKRREDPRVPMLADARKRAKARNLEYNLIKDDLIIPEYCPVLGIPIHVSTSGKRSANSPSLDRVNNSKGYTKENVCVISLRANTLKNDATIDELENIVNYMKEKLWHGTVLIKQPVNE